MVVTKYGVWTLNGGNRMSPALTQRPDLTRNLHGPFDTEEEAKEAIERSGHRSETYFILPQYHPQQPLVEDYMGGHCFGG